LWWKVSRQRGLAIRRKTARAQGLTRLPGTGRGDRWDEHEWLAERFEENRTRLRAVAYRMLGSTSEGDDAVQEAGCGWQLRHERRREPRRMADDGRRAGVPRHTAVAGLAARGALGVRQPEPILSPEDGGDPEHEALLGFTGSIIDRRIDRADFSEVRSALLCPSSNKALKVEVAGIEPASSGDLLGLLRAQPADRLVRRLPQADHRRTSLAALSPARREAHPVG
jgi:hypothetical protein